MRIDNRDVRRVERLLEKARSELQALEVKFGNKPDRHWKKARISKKEKEIRSLENRLLRISIPYPKLQLVPRRL